MKYFEEEVEILAILKEWLDLSLQHTILFYCDTEVANWNLPLSQRTLSLFQLYGPFIIAPPSSSNGLYLPPKNNGNQQIYILDIFNHLKKQGEKNNTILNLIEQFMQRQTIIKIFHNAVFDVSYLINCDLSSKEELEMKKQQVKSVICTLQLCKEIPYFMLPISSHKLSSLYVYFCEQKKSKPLQLTEDAMKEENDLILQFKNQLELKQKKDDLQHSLYWNTRPLTDEELEYASNDLIYLQTVYEQLYSIHKLLGPCLNKEEAVAQTSQMETELIELEKEIKVIESKREYFESRMKQQMEHFAIKESKYYELKSEEKRLRPSLSFHELEKQCQQYKVKLPSCKVQLTKAIRESFAKKGVDIMEGLKSSEIVQKLVKKKSNQQDEQLSDDEL